MSSALQHSHYKPAKGGHAPGDLRDAFMEAVDAFQDWEDGQPEPTVDLRDMPTPISKIFGLCWNCTDTLPSVVVSQIAWLTEPYFDDTKHPGTYASGSRTMMVAVNAEADKL
jgi:hypothetical protein